MKKIFILLLLFFVNDSYATSYPEEQSFKQIFKDHHIIGTFVLYDVANKNYLVHNPQRSIQKFVPASTFKVLNSLIALTTGAVKNVDEVFFHYDGSPLYLKTWEKDMNMREAIKVSNFVAYQQLARKIGLKRMAQNVAMVGYGNKTIGNVVDRFWVDGPLKITAMQQIQFLTHLAQYKLPFPQNIQKSVAEITILKKSNDWVLHGKTGLGDVTKSLGVAWFVGWLENHGHLYIFAMNMDLQKGQDVNQRVAVTEAILKSQHLMQ